MSRDSGSVENPFIPKLKTNLKDLLDFQLGSRWIHNGQSCLGLQIISENVSKACSLKLILINNKAKMHFIFPSF